MARFMDRVLAPWRGPAAARRAHGRALAQHGGLRTGLAELTRLCPAPTAEDPDTPIFLLSAGWRSGSTLLQRLIMSGTDTLIWGEPYDECGMLQALADSLQAFRRGWPPDDYFYDGTPPTQLTGTWVANLHPTLEDLRAGHRALLDRMLAQPAHRAGAKRWGIKEVRLTTEHAAWLRWLYPNARFLLIYRDPYAAYRSYCRYGSSWYDTFPDKPVRTATAFGRHWRELVTGFLRDADALNALTIRYEDLTHDPSVVDAIGTYLGLNLDRAVIQSKVGSSERRARHGEGSQVERWLLGRAVSPLARELGYLG